MSSARHRDRVSGSQKSPHRSGKQHDAVITLTEQHTALRAKDRSGFICRMKFRNEAPEIPFEPKFLAYPFDPTRLTRYQTTDLEKNYKFSIHTEPDLGIHIDLIEPEQYEPPENGAEMLPEDEELMVDEKKNPSSRSAVDDSTKSSAPWLHKTVYYGNDDLYGDQQLNRTLQPTRDEEVLIFFLSIGMVGC